MRHVFMWAGRTVFVLGLLQGFVAWLLPRPEQRNAARISGILYILVALCFFLLALVDKFGV